MNANLTSTSNTSSNKLVFFVAELFIPNINDIITSATSHQDDKKIHRIKYIKSKHTPDNIPLNNDLRTGSDPELKINPTEINRITPIAISQSSLLKKILPLLLKRRSKKLGYAACVKFNDELLMM